MPNLVVDIGNTNTKLAVFNNRELIHFQQLAQFNEATFKTLIEKYKIEYATASSVSKPLEELSNFLNQYLKYVPFSTSVIGGIKNGYETMSTLGLDRWAKVIAAHRLYAGENCLMIDAGTCITFDALSASQEYNGGSISLGIKMRFEALHHFTGKLPLIEWERSEVDIPDGTSTINAIKNGVLQGITNEVEGYILAANKQYSNLKVIITGGDAVFLNKQLKNSIFATQIIDEPYLVLKGLNEVITLAYVQ